MFYILGLHTLCAASYLLALYLIVGYTALMGRFDIPGPGWVKREYFEKEKYSTKFLKDNVAFGFVKVEVLK